MAVVLIVVGVGAVVLGSGRFPGSVAILVLGITFAWYGIAGYESALINFVTLAAFFRLGQSDGFPRKVLITGVAVVTAPIVMAVVGDEPVEQAASAVGWLLAAVLFGEFLRNRRLDVERYAERARQAESDAERRVIGERLRIARDLHDVLAHTVSAMTVQAGVAADALDRDREQARRALVAIRESGRAAIGEVRATVAVLRDGHDADGTSPVPTIAQVRVLADAARAQGLDVDVDIECCEHSLPDVVELTVYRIVQEATTNVLRHADARSMRISIREANSSLEVEVRDDGRGMSTNPRPGLGLGGMAERVESIGGVLHHGDAGDGWVVHASLPLEDERA